MSDGYATNEWQITYDSTHDNISDLMYKPMSNGKKRQGLIEMVSLNVFWRGSNIEGGLWYHFIHKIQKSSSEWRLWYHLIGEIHIYSFIFYFLSWVSIPFGFRFPSLIYIYIYIYHFTGQSYYKTNHNAIFYRECLKWYMFESVLKSWFGIYWFPLRVHMLWVYNVVFLTAETNLKLYF